VKKFLFLEDIMLRILNGKKDGFLGKDKIYIGRKGYGLNGSVLANKFVIGKDGTREEVIEQYRKWLWLEFNKKGEVYEELVRIGKLVKAGNNVDLVCWCKPLACHGDVVKSCVEWMIKQGIT
jgi:hypothetical protein